MTASITASLGEERLAALVAAVPQLGGLSLDAIATPLGGLSNRNVRLDAPGGSFVLRIPRRPSGPYLIDRDEEAAATRFAGEAGIGPELVFRDASGVLLTRWIAGSRTMSAEAFRADEGAVARAGETLRRLHGSGRRFARRFDALAILDDYRAALRARGEANDWPAPVTEALAALRRRLSALDVDLAPSHCDPVPENCLDDGARLFLVDWEYARMNDPAWDLAYLAVEGGFDAAHDEALLRGYHDATLHAGRLQAFKFLVAVLNASWSGLQASDHPLGPASRWREDRIVLAASLARQPRLAAWLDAQI